MSTKSIPPAPRWDLDSIFPGGSGSPQFKAHRDKVQAMVKDTRAAFDTLPRVLDDAAMGAWADFVLKLQDQIENTMLVVSFAHCLVSQNVSDSAAAAIESEGIQAHSEWQKLVTDFLSLTLNQSDPMWEKLVSSPKLAPIRYWLDDSRDLMRRKMSAEMESLAIDLSVSGFHAWNQLYDKMAGDLRVDFVENGKTSSLSLGQLSTKMGSPDRAIRQQAFEKLTEAWKSREDLAAMILNAIAGFRLALYGRRKWTSPLYETLAQSRLRQESLDAMWSVIARESHQLQPYLDAKMRLLGIDTFRWYDEFAPCGQSERLFPYAEAADFVVQHVGEFSGHMGEFCRMAIDKRWIEAEDRPGKAGGGYCTGMGPFRQSRIFMTYAGSYENLLTMAHELGHAYHSYVLKDKPFLATRYSKPLAETASIFNELLVTDAAQSASSDTQEKLMLLDQKLQQPYVMFCDIHCRYLFDRAFHQERQKGIVSKDRLCELMIDAQKKAYGSLLDESGHHPLFWASKLHFFLSDEPFYNYPYTFGYLFAGGVYDRAKKEGPAFAERYKALLADTGSMSTEDVARKHLGVDLTKEDFWKDAVARSLSSVAEFVQVAAKA